MRPGTLRADRPFIRWGKSGGEFLIPDWLHILAFVALAAGLGSSFIVAVDELSHRQHM
jgi:hypothetical protein